MNWPVLKSGSYPAGHCRRIVLVSGSSIFTAAISISTICFAIIDPRRNPSAAAQLRAHIESRAFLCAPDVDTAVAHRWRRPALATDCPKPAQFLIACRHRIDQRQLAGISKGEQLAANQNHIARTKSALGPFFLARFEIDAL